MAVHHAENSTRHKLNDKCIHDWYRFVLAYPDHLVTDLIDRFHVLPGQVVLDPFAGTGTTLIECKKRGIRSIGIDANPVAEFASRVKTEWDIDLEEFDRRSHSFLNSLRATFSELFPGSAYQMSFGDLDYIAQVLPTTVHAEPLVDVDAVLALVPQGAISSLPLRRVLVARQILDSLPDDRVTDILQLALMTSTVREMSNLGFGPEVYVKKHRRQDADLVSALASKLENVRSDLEYVQGIETQGQTMVYAGDARNLAQFISEPIDFVITSPPYPNEKDYTRTTRLELVLFEFMRDRRDLREIKETMLRSHTRNIYEADNDSELVRDIPEIQAVAEAVEKRRIERGAISGFERLYHRVVTEYFGGMYRTLQQIEQIMPAGGKVAMVVGDQSSYFQVPIQTAKLLSTVVCRKLHFAEVETLLWRTRIATATRQNVSENILVLERT